MKSARFCKPIDSLTIERDTALRNVCCSVNRIVYTEYINSVELNINSLIYNSVYAHYENISITFPLNLILFVRRTLQNDPELRFWQSLTSLVRSQVESTAVAPTPPATPPVSNVSASHKHSIEQLLSENRPQFQEFPALESPGGAVRNAAQSHEALCDLCPRTAPVATTTTALHMSASGLLLSPQYTDIYAVHNDESSLLDDVYSSALRTRWTLAQLLLDAHTRQ